MAQFSVPSWAVFIAARAEDVLGLASSLVYLVLICIGVLFIALGAKNTWKQRKRPDSLWIATVTIGVAIVIYMIAVRHVF
jgi:hypothetical protein